MNKRVILFLIGLCLLSFRVLPQSQADSTASGLPGDNLDLYAVLDLFQKSKTIEDFEKSLNMEETGINNMDLDLDKKVDFIKVVTKQDKDDFTFILQIAVTKAETQDVAVIMVSKDENKKVTMQIIGNEDLYGKDYIVDMKESSKPAVTANPGYTGTDTVKVVSAPATTTVVVVEQTPVVQYVYSPAYVPYYPPYYYGYYPPYYRPWGAITVGIYWGNHAHYHHHHGYHGNTTIIHNENNFNNYNRNRNSSNTVNHNKARGDYNRGNNAASTRPSNTARPSTRESGNRSSNRQSASPSTRQSGPTREAAGMTPSNNNRQSQNMSSQQGGRSSNGASRYSGGSSFGGGSRGGGFGGGGSRGGGGRRR